MNLPILAIELLPDLDVMTGLFGSLTSRRGHDDTIIILATYIYEVIPPGR